MTATVAVVVAVAGTAVLYQQCDRYDRSSNKDKDSISIAFSASQRLA